MYDTWYVVCRMLVDQGVNAFRLRLLLYRSVFRDVCKYKTEIEKRDSLISLFIGMPSTSERKITCSFLNTFPRYL